jgi:hypothetical protein
LECVEGPNIRYEKENTVEKLRDIGLDNSLFLDCNTRRMDTKSKNRQMGVCTAKEATNRVNKQPMKLEKILANHMSDKGLEYIKRPYNSTTNPSNLVRKWAMRAKHGGTCLQS